MKPGIAPTPSVLAALERWLLPTECLLCESALQRASSDGLVCELCISRWRRIPHPICPRCGQPIEPELECRLCDTWPEGFGGVVSAVWLDDSARRAVHLLKYEGWWRVAEAMAAVMRPVGLSPESTALVPVPLGSARLRQRGYNQSAVLARELARGSGLPVWEALLTRIRETKTQTTLTPEERAANLAGAFRPGPRCPTRVVLVDDVFTTGATLRSAADALLAAGCRRVTAVTFARAEPPLAAASRALDLASRKLS